MVNSKKEHECLTNAVDSLSLARAYVYNTRSELSGASIGTNDYAYAYDTIGNRTAAVRNAATTQYAANNLNQYASVNSMSFAYDLDGNLLTNSTHVCEYDAENRLICVSPLAVAAGNLRVRNQYDFKHRRICKTVDRYENDEWIVAETHTFIYDGWNVVAEFVAYANGTSKTIEYFWGDDLSDSAQGAGGVGGLLAVSVNGNYYFPTYDFNGNVTAYISENGQLAAWYAYDGFGNSIDSYGDTSSFSFRFSTKYLDAEICMYYYGRRFYLPHLGRWFNRDPIEEDGGENLYAFCKNNGIVFIDLLGMSFWDDFIDAAKVAVGLCGVVAGATIGGAASWTGVGAIGGLALMVIGADQVMEGLTSIHSRMHGGPASDNSPVKEIMRITAVAITKRENSALEQYMYSAYAGIQLASSCYGGFVTAQSVVQTLRVTYIPEQTVRVLKVQNGVLKYSWKLKGSYWNLKVG